MKTSSASIIGLCVAFVLSPFAIGQPAPDQPPKTASGGASQRGGQDKPVEFKKFDLDFKGGTPAELIAAISAARGKVVNAIIPTEAANQQVPGMKVVGVDVAQLFIALRNASLHWSKTPDPRFGASQLSYGFETEGRPTEDSLWYFKVNDGPGTNSSPAICRFYNLSPYMDAGLTVDDITTAIQTGWRMRGLTPPPSISFHKETRLLIAVGEQFQLDVIDDALRALGQIKPVSAKTPPGSPSEKAEKSGS